MTPTEVAATLRQFNEWRRGDYEPSEQPAPPDPREIGEAIDAAVEMIDRLEAAEKERDGLRHCFNEWADKTEWVQQGFNEGTISAKYLGMHRADVMARLLDEAEKERDALRAKNERIDEAMESLLIRCDDSDSAMYGTLSTSFVRDTVRIARGAMEESK